MMRHWLNDYFVKWLALLNQYAYLAHAGMHHEDFHQMRVNVKKIRALTAFCSFVHKSDLDNKGIQKCIRKLYRSAGAVRELQLQLSFLKHCQLMLHRDFRPFEVYLQQCLDNAFENYHLQYKEYRPARLIKEWKELLKQIADVREELLCDEIQKFFFQNYHEALQMGGDGATDEQKHESRKLLKKAMYMANASKKLFPIENEMLMLLPEVKNREENLGKGNDRVVAYSHLCVFFENADAAQKHLIHEEFEILKDFIQNFSEQSPCKGSKD